MRHLLLPFLLLLATVMFGQSLLPTPRNIQKAYDKGTRSTSGRPGPAYWQNTANYDIRADYDPESRRLNGDVEISYSNASPDTLKHLVFRLYPNIYKKGAPRDGRIDPADISDGVSIDSIWVNGQRVSNSWLIVDNTVAFARQTLEPGHKVDIKISYHYTLNKGSHNRTGEIEPGAAFIAYFFPRVAVYDDIDGWNTYPYTGTQEFYNDFCHFSVGITVPADYLVWATGDLKNADEVLTSKYADRLAHGAQNDEIVFIVDSNDLKAKDITVPGIAQHTWHFDADDVTDFAFAVSNHYLWQSSSIVVDPVTKRRTRIDAAFNQKHRDYFEVASFTRKTVEAMSYQFPAWPFPYPHITVFDGLDQMEYPMMVNDNPLEDRTETITLTDHEVFHTMFPFYMGINETKYAWMDEGWATIGEWLISAMIDSTIADDYGVAPTADNAGNETDLPIVTLSTELNRGYFTNSYPKPAMGYLYVKDYLGDRLFTQALHHFIKQWNGKHPMPNDFFYSMNEGAGKNLNWFWKKWFFGSGVPDLGIRSVKKSKNGVAIVVAMKGTMPVPIDLQIEFADGSVQKVHRSIGAWENGNNTVSITISTTKKAQRVLLGDVHTPDSHPADNSYLVR